MPAARQGGAGFPPPWRQSDRPPDAVTIAQLCLFSSPFLPVYPYPSRPFSATLSVPPLFPFDVHKQASSNLVKPMYVLASSLLPHGEPVCRPVSPSPHLLHFPENLQNEPNSQDSPSPLHPAIVPWYG